MHNREHDWAYHLGFTEALWNMQKDNFGNGGLGNDVEQGNAQAGGVSGGPASGFAARDNANQITPVMASHRSPTCTCGSRLPARSTAGASTATST
jgi:hypothetical protein